MTSHEGPNRHREQAATAELKQLFVDVESLALQSHLTPEIAVQQLFNADRQPIIVDGISATSDQPHFIAYSATGRDLSAKVSSAADQLDLQLDDAFTIGFAEQAIVPSLDDEGNYWVKDNSYQPSQVTFEVYKANTGESIFYSVSADKRAASDDTVDDWKITAARSISADDDEISRILAVRDVADIEGHDWENADSMEIMLARLAVDAEGVAFDEGSMADAASESNRQLQERLSKTTGISALEVAALSQIVASLH